MFRHTLLGLVLFGCVSSFQAQKSEDLIPTAAVTVFSLNNIQILQKVSMDDLVNYAFMAEIQQELFDGSTNGKTIKESGIDFDQKINVFFGSNPTHEVAGFTFGVKNLENLFTVFDDFQEVESELEGVRYFNSYFNHLLIKGNTGLLLRVDPLQSHVKKVTDSTWYERGYGELPSSYYQEFYDLMDEDYSEEDIDFDDSGEMEDTYDVSEELESMEEGETEVYDLPEEDLSVKNYAELRDSIYAQLQTVYFNAICVDLFLKQNNLAKQDPDLKATLEKKAEAVFYLDNSRSVQQGQGFSYFRTMFPSLHKEWKELYKGNKIMGELHLKEDQLEANISAVYGETLGSVYEKMNNTKFDKNVVKYIHKDAPAYFTYNINLREAYEQVYKIVIPLLKKEKNARIATNVLAVELLNEFINKDAVFETYRGSMFGTYNGVKKVTVKRIEYTYDEDFNFEETEVFSEEDMPVFTLGFSTGRNDIPETVLKQIAKITSECKKMDGYWIFENAIFNSVPLYMINQDGLFILTNDEDLALQHASGYGRDKMPRKKMKAAMKSGFVYSEIDWSQTLTSIPKEMFSEEQAEMLGNLSGQSGTMVLTSSKTTKSGTEFKVNYSFNGDYENSGKYVLDLINSLYVVLK